MELGVERMAEWMRSNRLQLNPEKTDFLWCATRRRCRPIHLDTAELSVCGALIRPSTSVRDLGVLLESDLSSKVKSSFIQPTFDTNAEGFTEYKRKFNKQNK